MNNDWQPLTSEDKQRITDSLKRQYNQCQERIDERHKLIEEHLRLRQYESVSTTVLMLLHWQDQQVVLGSIAKDLGLPPLDQLEEVSMLVNPGSRFKRRPSVENTITDRYHQ